MQRGVQVKKILGLEVSKRSVTNPASLGWRDKNRSAGCRHVSWAGLVESDVLSRTAR